MATDLPPDIKILGIWIGAALFIVVIGIVAVFAWYKPTNLMYDQYGYLMQSGQLAPFGDDGKEMDFHEVTDLPSTEKKT